LLRKLGNLSYEDDDSLKEVLHQKLNATLPFATLHILVGPCVCALQTAVDLAEYWSSNYLRVLIRVDDRINTSCLKSRAQKKSALDAIVGHFEKAELDGESIGGYASYIDRQWVYQRLHELESRSDEPDIFDARNIFDPKSYRPPHSNRVDMIIIGEVQFCTPYIQAEPFPWKAKLPAAGEIYRLRTTRYNSVAPKGWEWERLYLGAYTKRTMQQNTYAQNAQSSAKNEKGKQTQSQSSPSSSTTRKRSSSSNSMSESSKRLQTSLLSTLLSNDTSSSAGEADDQPSLVMSDENNSLYSFD
jgi:hypothetical protein